MTTNLNTKKLKLITDFTNNAIQNKLSPGVELLLAKNDSIIFHDAFGRIDKEPKSPKLIKNSIFDLASLTKPLATSSAIMLLVEQGKLSLEDKVTEYIKEFYREDTKKITIKQLLTHTSGLPSWSKLYDKDFELKRGFKNLVTLPLENKPGEKVVYSCMGFILLGEIIRRITKNSLSDFCQDNLFSPLDLNLLNFKPDLNQKNIVPTSYCPLRGKMLRGIVHDENSYLFNSEGGNAGLFGTAEQVFKFCQMLMNKGHYKSKRILSTLTVESMFLNHNKGGVPRAIGWDISQNNSGYLSCGDLMPEGSFGHLGFTGTSIWFDLKSKIIIIVLSNRVNYNSPDNKEKIMSFRPKIHNLLLSLI